MAQKAIPKTKSATTKKTATAKKTTLKSATATTNRKPIASNQIKSKPTASLKDKTKVELIKEAKNSRIHITTRMTKDDIIKALKKR